MGSQGKRSKGRSGSKGEASSPPVPPPPTPAAGPGLVFTMGSGDRWRRILWGLSLLVLLVGTVWVADQVRAVTVPLMVAFAIAYVLDPIVDWFELRRVGRTPAILLLLGAALIVVTSLVLLLGPQIAEEFSVLPAKLRELLERAIPWLEQTLDLRIPGNVRGAIEAILAEAEGVDLRQLAAPAGSIAKAIYGGTVGVLGAVAGAVMVPVFAFYLLRDFDVIVGYGRDLLPARHRDGISARFAEIDASMSSFVRGQLVVAAILAVLYSVGLSLVGLPLALLVGMLAGLGNMIPYLGTAVGVVLATLMALLDWGGIVQLLLVYGVFVLVQTLEGWVITPKVVGESVGLSPFAVIVAVLVFGDLFGFFGVLIAVPLAAVLKILGRVGLEHYRSSTFYREV